MYLLSWKNCWFISIRESGMKDALLNMKLNRLEDIIALVALTDLDQ